MSGHYCLEIKNRQEVDALIIELKASVQACPYILPKAEFRAIRLKNIPAPAANILKQEMLARGGEVVVWRDAVLGRGQGDVLLLGTLSQLKLLIAKLQGQPFGLESLARDLERLLAPVSDGLMDLPHARTLAWGRRTLIMGILNRSPESFAGSGRTETEVQALQRAWDMIEAGADIIDIGGCSSRPGGDFVSLDEERRRVLPLIEALSEAPVPLSVDTFRAAVAKDAIASGAHIINNIGMWKLDPELLPVLAAKNWPVVLMHNRLHLPYRSSGDIIGDIMADLNEAMAQAERAGLSADRIIIDPGIGFGQAGVEDWWIIKQLRSFSGLGRPLLVGLSRKRCLSGEDKLSPDQRLEATLAAQTLAIAHGADILRVHDVQAARRAAAIADAILAADGKAGSSGPA